MIPVRQTLWDGNNPWGIGNCYSACLASILEVPLDCVPCFYCENGTQFMWFYERWLNGFGWSIQNVSGEGRLCEWDKVSPAWCIGSGTPLYQQETGNWHAVVVYQQSIWFDPWPDGPALGESDIVVLDYLVPLDPSRPPRLPTEPWRQTRRSRLLNQFPGSGGIEAATWPLDGMP